MANEFLLMQENVKKCLNGADNRSETRDKSCVRVFTYDLQQLIDL